MSLFDSVDDSEDVFSSPKLTPSPPPEPSSPTDESAPVNQEDDLFGGESVTEGGGEKREVGGEKVNEEEQLEGEGEKEGDANVEGSNPALFPMDPLTASLQEKKGASPDDDLFKESREKTPDPDPLFSQPTQSNDLFSDNTKDMGLFSSDTNTRSKNIFVYTEDDDLFKSNGAAITQSDEQRGEGDNEGFVHADEAPSLEEVDHVVLRVEQARQEKERERAGKPVPEKKEVKEVYSLELSYDERAAMRKKQREQRRLQGAKKSDKHTDHRHTTRPSPRSDVRAAMRHGAGDLRSKPGKPVTKPSPKPSPSTGRHTTIKIESRRTPTPEHVENTSTDPQEQIHQLTSRLQKAQSENAALSRDKKKLEAELAEARSKVKHLEGTVAKKDAEIAELKRKAKDSKPSSSHTRPKKGDSPVITRKTSDSSPRMLKRVGSGEKASPSGSPAEAR